MRKTFLILLVLPALINAAEPFVEIYKTHDNGMFGRSEDRDIVLSIKESVFRRHNTLDVDESKNFLTAVVIDTKTVNRLDELFKTRDYIQKGFVKISKDESIYTIEDDNNFLSFSFSIEKPASSVLDTIKRHYNTMPDIRDIVVDHYTENYIIRIHSAENILLSEAKEITYDEALVMATIIGDKDQWLWGIHDGRDYLKELLF